MSIKTFWQEVGVKKKELLGDHLKVDYIHTPLHFGIIVAVPVTPTWEKGRTKHKHSGELLSQQSKGEVAALSNLCAQILSGKTMWRVYL